jgi:hypothetical protein
MKISIFYDNYINDQNQDENYNMPFFLNEDDRGYHRKRRF